MKKVVRILLIALGICVALFTLIVVPLLTNNWGCTIFVGIIVAVVILFVVIVSIVQWAWSKD